MTRTPPSVIWAPAPHLHNVMRMAARDWRSDLSFFHESIDLLSIDRVDGTRGPVNHHRGLSHVCRPKQDVLLFSPGYAHRATGGPAADFRVLLVPVATVRRAALELTGRDREVQTRGFVTPALYPLLDSLHGLLAVGKPASPLAVQSAYKAVVQHLLEQCSDIGTGSLDSPDDETVRRAVEYIDDLITSSPRKDLDLEQLAHNCGADGIFKLSRDFKEITAVSPYQYLKLRKAELARHWLGERRRRSILSIAQRLGYTPQSFSRSFKQVFRVSARDYRSALSATAHPADG